DFLANNLGVSGDVMRRVERHRGVPIGSLDSLVGKHLQSVYQLAVCSSAPVTVGSATIISPLSFISAAAGVLLAAELVTARSPELRAYALGNYFRFDALYAPNPSMRQVKPRDISGRCICADNDYVQIYRKRYQS